nr:copia protein [Tanacetum cinerariifolium]
MVSVDDKKWFDHYVGQRELLVSKPTTLGDIFLLARSIEARFDDQAAPVMGTSAGLESNKVVNIGDDSEFPGPVTPTSDLESSSEVLVDGNQDEAKVMKVVDVAELQNSNELDVLEGNGIIGVRVSENNKGVDKGVQCFVYTIHVLIPFLKRLNDKYIKKKKMKVAMQRRLWDPEGQVTTAIENHGDDGSGDVEEVVIEKVTPDVDISQSKPIVTVSKPEKILDPTFEKVVTGLKKHSNLNVFKHSDDVGYFKTKAHINKLKPLAPSGPRSLKKDSKYKDPSKIEVGFGSFNKLMCPRKKKKNLLMASMERG